MSFSSRRYLLPWKLMTKYFGVCGVMAKTNKSFEHKPQIFGHDNALWNFKKISPWRETHYLPRCNRALVTNRRSWRSLRDDISKEIPPKLRSGLIFKGLRHLNLSQNTPVNTGTYSIKPWKIRPRAMRAIDSVLKRSAWPEYCSFKYQGLRQSLFRVENLLLPTWYSSAPQAGGLWVNAGSIFINPADDWENYPPASSGVIPRYCT